MFTQISNKPHIPGSAPSRGGLAAWLLFISLGAPAALEAQTRPMRFERISVEQGLSQNTVTCILQDRTGLLWIGTQEGLNRYDGYGFQIYKRDPANPSSLPHDWILSLAEDPSGDLWIGTEGGGLARWQRSTDSFIRYRPDPANPEGLSGDRVLVITVDSAGYVWLGTFEAGLNRLDPATGKFERFRHDPSDPQSLSDDRIGAVYEDRRGHLWIGTQGGLNRFKPGSKGFVQYRHRPGDPTSLSDDRVRAILEDRKGDLWIGTYQGLNRIDPAAPGVEAGGGGAGSFGRYLQDASDPGSLSHNRVRALLEDRSGRLWIGTDGGLNLWQSESESFVSYRHDAANLTSLGSDQVVVVYQDSGGILWLSTAGAGLSKWNPATWSFSHYMSAATGGDGQSNNVFAISEDLEDKLWLGTFGGLQRIDRETGETTHFRHDPRLPTSLGDDRVTALLHDRDGVLWAGTISGGLNRFEPATATFRRYLHDPATPGTLSSNSVASLHQDRFGQLWVGTYGGGLNRLRVDGTFAVFDHDPIDPRSLSNDRVVSMAEDAAGRLWIATDGGGLNLLDRDAAGTVSGAFLRVQHDPASPASLAGDELIAVHLDGEGRLWAGTKGSGFDKLERLDEASGEAEFSHYSALHGLPSNIVWGLESDRQGFLWLSTSNGLSRFDPRTETFKNYDTSHGLQSNEFNMGAHFRSPSGELFFGGVNGFNAFHPEKIETNPHVPPVILTSFSKLNQPVDLGRPVFEVDEIFLDYRDDIVSFEVAALDYAAPAKNRYRYELEGFQDEWIDNGSRRQVTFTDLDPGSYVLNVQGSNSDGVWNEQGASIRLHVAPPPWRTWWAYTSYGLGLAALALGFVRLHKVKLRRERKAAADERAIAERERAISRRLREIDKLKDEFLANTSHELRSPLHGITGLTESLIAGSRGELPEPVKSDLSMVVSCGHRLAALVDDVLDLSSLRHGELKIHRQPVDLWALVEVVLTLSRPLVGSKRLELANAVPADLPPADADENRLQQILHNLVGNAIKFTRSGSIEVAAETRPGKAEANGEELLIRVSDSGIGIPEETRKRIFDAFEQVDGSVEREHPGSGLGLAITRQLVELHGGSIWVESNAMRGSTFSFTLPVASVQPDNGPRQEALGLSRIRALGAETLLAGPDGRETGIQPAVPAATWSSSVDFRILVVDDDPVIRQVLVHQLTARSYQVLEASNGTEALQVLGEENPDLVLLDIMMPKMSGYEVCRQIRQSYSLEELPILFLTARDQLSDLVTGYTVGGNDYLVKPIARDELLARVKTHLKLLRVHRNLGLEVERKASHIKALRGLLPICSSCKKIRDDEGYWKQLEVYISTHSEAQLSHGICPDCFERIYGSMGLREELDLKEKRPA